MQGVSCWSCGANALGTDRTGAVLTRKALCGTRPAGGHLVRRALLQGAPQHRSAGIACYCTGTTSRLACNSSGPTALHSKRKSTCTQSLTAFAGRADYFGSVPNLAARLMAVAQPGQILVDGRLNSLPSLQVSACLVVEGWGLSLGTVGPDFWSKCKFLHTNRSTAGWMGTPHCLVSLATHPPLQWKEDGGAMMVSQDLGLIEFTPLGYLQVKVGRLGGPLLSGGACGWARSAGRPLAGHVPAAKARCPHYRGTRGGTTMLASSLPMTLPPVRRAWTSPSWCSRCCPPGCGRGSTRSCPPRAAPTASAPTTRRAWAAWAAAAGARWPAAGSASGAQPATGSAPRARRARWGRGRAAWGMGQCCLLCGWSASLPGCSGRLRSYLGSLDDTLMMPARFRLLAFHKPCSPHLLPGHPLQGSATSVRTPSIKRGLQGSSARGGRMRTALLSHREESVLGSRRNRWVGQLYTVGLGGVWCSLVDIDACNAICKQKCLFCLVSHACALHRFYLPAARTLGLEMRACSRTTLAASCQGPTCGEASPTGMESMHCCCISFNVSLWGSTVSSGILDWYHMPAAIFDHCPAAPSPWPAAAARWHAPAGWACWGSGSQVGAALGAAGSIAE